MTAVGTEQLKQRLKERVLVLDGAFGTMIQSCVLSEEDFRGDRYASHPCELKGNNDVLSLTRPDVVAAIHRAYLEAGADIIETNTFGANAVSQYEYRTQEDVYDMNLASARIGGKMADEYTSRQPDKPRFVAGILGPTSRTCSISTRTRSVSTWPPARCD